MDMEREADRLKKIGKWVERVRESMPKKGEGGEEAGKEGKERVKRI